MQDITHTIPLGVAVRRCNRLSKLSLPDLYETCRCLKYWADETTEETAYPKPQLRLWANAASALLSRRYVKRRERENLEIERSGGGPDAWTWYWYH